MDVVDDDPVFDLVLRARLEFGGEAGVVVDVAGTRRRAGERMGSNDRPVDLDEQLGRGADEPVDREAVARRERRPQPAQDGVDADRRAGLDADRSGDHRLRERPVTHGVPGCGDRIEISLDGDESG